MSLTSYRAAPPREGMVCRRVKIGDVRVFVLVYAVYEHPGFGRPGNDLLSHALRRSTIGAEGLHGRVRDGIGWAPLAIATRSSKPGDARQRCVRTGMRMFIPHEVMSGCANHCSCLTGAL